MGQKVVKKSAKIIRETRRKHVTEQLLKGLNYRDIASKEKVSLGTISNDVKAILAKMSKEQVQDLKQIRDIEVQRLDKALAAIWPKVLKGDCYAIDRMLKIMDKRSALIGLDKEDALMEAIKVDIEKIRQERWKQVAPVIAKMKDRENNTGTEQEKSDGTEAGISDTENL